MGKIFLLTRTNVKTNACAGWRPTQPSWTERKHCKCFCGLSHADQPTRRFEHGPGRCHDSWICRYADLSQPRGISGFDGAPDLSHNLLSRDINLLGESYCFLG